MYIVLVQTLDGEYFLVSSPYLVSAGDMIEFGENRLAVCVNKAFCEKGAIELVKCVSDVYEAKQIYLPIKMSGKEKTQ